MCEAAYAACQGITPPTSLTVVWRRLVAANGNQIPGQGWTRIGQYCEPPNIPGAPPPPPRLTIADVQREFHLTPWATAGITIQPPKGVTLVNLKNFYQLTWTQAGFEPGEIDTIDPARMLGHTVKIRPRIVDITFTFGDGTTLGPTTDPGAPWPTGKITHTYLDKGTYQVTAAINVTADFTVDGSEWIPIDNTVTLRSTPTTLTAKEAHRVTLN